jgi:rhomboid protease GluP
MRNEPPSPLEPPETGDDRGETPTPRPIGGIPPAPIERPPIQQVRVRLPDNRPVMTLTILGITVLFFILQEASRYIYQQDVVALYAEKINSLIIQGQLWRLITPILVHANILHIGFNMYALYVFGKSLERFYGPWKLLFIYLVSGFAGVVFSFLLTDSASLGASTAIFGLLAAEGVFAYQNQAVFGHQARRVLRSIINIAIINLLLGLTPGIDNWGHLGGLLGGLMVSWFGGPKYELVGAAGDFSLEDKREPREFILAILGTGLVFGIIVLGVLAGSSYWR